MLLAAFLLMQTPVAAQHFPLCSRSPRVTCIVDGDTFWLRGEKYRIADIDTPEVTRAKCVEEQRLGQRATDRMRALLDGQPLVLRSIKRTHDRYGRKLVIVSDGQSSLGAILISEGLAHHWTGKRQSWCDGG